MRRNAHRTEVMSCGFGEEGEGFLRLAIVENSQRLRQAVRAIGTALKVEALPAA